jgi:hypothetical protein
MAPLDVEQAELMREVRELREQIEDLRRALDAGAMNPPASMGHIHGLVDRQRMQDRYNRGVIDVLVTFGLLLIERGVSPERIEAELEGLAKVWTDAGDLDRAEPPRAALADLRRRQAPPEGEPSGRPN